MEHVYITIIMSKVDMNVCGGAVFVNTISCQLKIMEVSQHLFWMLTVRISVLIFKDEFKTGLKCSKEILGYVFTPFIIVIS